ncbi:MAG: FAD-binding oxidoreductase, partial [Pseudomonadota bacterium]
ELAGELSATTGIDLSLQQRGGYSIFLDEQSLEQRLQIYEKLKSELGGHYPFDVLGHNAIKKEEPHIGRNVVGAILHHEDGHLNPLNFYRAITQACNAHGLQKIIGRVSRVEPISDGFTIHSEASGTHQCEKVVLASGLGTVELGRPLGFSVPIRPQRGQVLITEKMPPLINRPSDEIRQVNEGAVQIGASAEEVGTDDSETTTTTAALAANAIQQYPVLAKAQLIRSWGALRVMSPDGFPIYQQSAQYPGAYFTTCHSGITLAAAHARLIPQWLCGEGHQFNDPDITLDEFSEQRFND